MLREEGYLDDVRYARLFAHALRARGDDVVARVAQVANRLVIEQSSRRISRRARSGFRLRRSQHDALQVLIDESWRGRRWAAESDISNCFGGIPGRDVGAPARVRFRGNADFDLAQPNTLAQ